MNRYYWVISATILAVGNIIVGCTPGGVGDPCVPEDEYEPGFAGYGVEEVNVEAMSFQCETRLCLVNHFQGRVTCPYGQISDPTATDEAGKWATVDAVQKRCKVPDGRKNNVTVDVQPQLMTRRANNAVYCSCRCAGPDKNARYCPCPSGYSCTLLNEIPLGSGESQLLGSYCVRNGTAYDRARDETGVVCSSMEHNCDYEGYAQGQNPFGDNAKL